MKNIHLLPTDKPSRLRQNKITKKISLVNRGIDLTSYNPINIYITSDEEIKVGDWVIEFQKGDNIGEVHFINGEYVIANDIQKKIILTTDQDLIKDGVQSIDDEFLEWFVKNPSCEEVEVFRNWSSVGIFDYEIIIPKEEPKQETLEEAAEKLYQEGLQNDLGLSFHDGVKFGAKWQQERMYSEEEVRKILWEYIKPQSTSEGILLDGFLEQFKKK